MFPDFSEFLEPTATIDSGHERVSAFVRSHTDAAGTSRDHAVRLYYAIRDGIRYDPYAIDLSIEGMRASTTLASGRGWCVPKAVLLAACCRVLKIPARLGFADVKNHLSTERLRKLMNTDIFFLARIHVHLYRRPMGQSHAGLQHRTVRAISSETP